MHIAFEEFSKSQLKFVQHVAELAAKPSYAESLYEIHAVDIVLSLVTNMNPSIRINVALILARLANYSEPCAKQILCSRSQFHQLLVQVGRENVRKTCATSVLGWPKILLHAT